MNPVSAPLGRVGNVHLISEGLAVRNTALGDTDGTIIPSRLVRKHPMVVERAGDVKVVGCVHDERVVDADGNWRRAKNLHKNGRQKRQRKNRRPGAVYANCTPWYTQTIWADVVGVGEVPPYFVNARNDRESAREGEKNWGDGRSHSRGKGEEPETAKSGIVAFIYQRSGSSR